MEYKDYYKVLGVDKKASQDEIKKAFRVMAVKLHPDKNPGDKVAEEKFKLANEANGVLGNPEKRKKYDELGENWQQYAPNGNSGQGARGGQRSAQGFGNGGQQDFSDFFEQFFGGQNKSRGGSSRQPGSFKGGDFETEIEITLEEAYAGTSRIIQLENEKLRVTTKPGAYQDQQLRIKGKGAAGSSEALRGDLFIRIKVKTQAPFSRKGDDVYLTHTIDLYTAVLGGETIVQTLSGQVKIKIDAGTQNGKSIRLKGKGMPVYEKAEMFGDLYIQLQVHIPEKLSEKQKGLFEELKGSV